MLCRLGHLDAIRENVLRINRFGDDMASLGAKTEDFAH